MGLFNFFRGTPKSIWDEPKMRSMVCQTRGQQVLQQVKNLKAVSRQHDADNVVVKYFQEAIAQWAEDPTLPDFLLCTILTVVSEHSSKKYAISIHEKLLELDGKVDLRPVYFSLGSLYHNLSLEELGGVICHGGPDSVYARMPSKKKELWAYHMATEAKAPPGRDGPAWTQLTAQAHFHARETAYNIGDAEKYEWHRNKLANLVPGVDLNDMMKFIEFTAKEQE